MVTYDGAGSVLDQKHDEEAFRSYRVAFCGDGRAAVVVPDFQQFLNVIPCEPKTFKADLDIIPTRGKWKVLEGVYEALLAVFDQATGGGEVGRDLANGGEKNAMRNIGSFLRSASISFAQKAEYFRIVAAARTEYEKTILDKNLQRFVQKSRDRGGSELANTLWHTHGADKSYLHMRVGVDNLQLRGATVAEKRLTVEDQWWISAKAMVREKAGDLVSKMEFSAIVKFWWRKKLALESGGEPDEDYAHCFSMTRREAELNEVFRTHNAASISGI